MTTYKQLEKVPYGRSGGVNVPLVSFETNLLEFYKVDMNPVFQRDYVWSEADDVAYIEWFLRTNESIRICPATTISIKRGSKTDAYQLIDGKQRCNALLKFCRGELKIFGQYFKDFEFKGFNPDVYFSFIDLEGDDLIDYYLAVNTTGVQHTEEEIEKARRLKGKI